MRLANFVILALKKKVGDSPAHSLWAVFHFWGNFAQLGPQFANDIDGIASVDGELAGDEATDGRREPRSTAIGADHDL